MNRAPFPPLVIMERLIIAVVFLAILPFTIQVIISYLKSCTNEQFLMNLDEEDFSRSFIDSV